MAEESTTAVAAPLAGNAALAVLKGAAALATGSAAMLAETLHSLADTGNQVEPAAPESRPLDRAA